VQGVRSVTVGTVVLLLLVVAALGKRSSPPSVPTITHNGVIYSAPNTDGRIAQIVASDATSGSRLWQVVVFETKIDPKLEEDVQWIFIVGIKPSGNSISIKDEHSRCWRLDLATKKVSRQYLGCLL
jgi:hypothetical protein